MTSPSWKNIVVTSVKVIPFPPMNIFFFARVHIGNSLFYGASMDPYTPGHYCDCPSTATPGNRVCNGNALVDASNLDASKDMILCRCLFLPLKC